MVQKSSRISLLNLVCRRCVFKSQILVPWLGFMARQWLVKPARCQGGRHCCQANPRRFVVPSDSGAYQHATLSFRRNPGRCPKLPPFLAVKVIALFSTFQRESLLSASNGAYNGVFQYGESGIRNHILRQQTVTNKPDNTIADIVNFIDCCFLLRFMTDTTIGQILVVEEDFS